MIHSSTKNFQPGLQPNSEQKADEMHVSPAIANANVSCIISLAVLIALLICQSVYLLSREIFPKHLSGL
jgi:hypothetical protein